MKKKKGFTLVELIGAFVVLAIVLGIVSVAYIKVTDYIKTTYYKGVEESVLISAGEFFAYNKEYQPLYYGDTKSIEISQIVEGGYSSSAFLARNKSVCGGNVIAYKDSSDKTRYYVCLKCDETDDLDYDDRDDYITNSSICWEGIDTYISVGLKTKDTNNEYSKTNPVYVNEDIRVTFESAYDVSKFVLRNASGVEYNCVPTTNSSGMKTCYVDVSVSGTYEAYGTANGKATNPEEITLLIDKTGPNFDIFDSSNNITGKEITIEYSEDLIITSYVKNIKDLESGIESIKYSFEKEGSEPNFLEIDENLESFTVNKSNLELATYNLIVRISDKFGNTTEKKVTYIVSKNYIRVAKPTSSNYCKSNLVYTGANQTLTTNSGEGYTFSNNVQKNSGTYTITAKLGADYAWEDGSLTDVTFTCEIKAGTAVMPTCVERVYTGSTQYLASGGANVTLKNNEGLNANSYTVVVNSNSNYAFSDGTTTKNLTCTIARANSVAPTVVSYSGLYDGNSHTISVSGGSGGTIKYSTDNSTWSTEKPTRTELGTTTVYVKVFGDDNHFDSPTITSSIGIYDKYVATLGSCKTGLVYNGSSQTLINKGNNVSYSVEKGTNAGNYTITATTNSGYVFSDDTTSKTLTCSIAKTSSTNPTLKSYTGTYDGSSHTITVSGGSGGTIQYSTDNSTWSTNKPTRTNVGTTIVYVRILGDSNHNNTSSITASIKINYSLTATTGSCYSRTYNGSSRTLAGGGANVSYSNNTRTSAGSQYVTVTANSNYLFSDGTTSKTLYCTISKKPLSITADDQTITYGNSISEGTYYVTTSGLVSGHTLSSITLTPSTTSITSNGYIYPSGAVIKSGSTTVTSNYDISYYAGDLVIRNNLTSVSKPTASSYCTYKTYNGSSQQIVYGSTYYYFTNDMQTNAGTYTVTAYLYDGYQWSDGTTSGYSISCPLYQKSLSITADDQTITYGNSISKGTSYVTTSGLVSGHTLSSISLTQSTTSVTSSGYIIPSGAVVKSGSTTVTSNYDISYYAGDLTIKSSVLSVSKPSCKANLVYSGSSQTLVNTGTGYTLSGNSGTNAGTYTVTASLNSGYKWSDGTTSSYSLSCTIDKAKATAPTVKSYNGIYDGKYHSLTVSGGSGGTIKYRAFTTWGISYSFAGPGSLTVYVKVFGDSNHYDSNEVSGTINITTNNSATVGSCNSLTYNGSSQTLASGGSNVSYSNNTATNAGSYTVTANPSTGYAFTDGSTSKTLSCSIAKSKTATTGSCNNLTYTGTSQTLASGGSNVSYSNNTATASGTHTVTVTANSNYTFSDGTTSKTLSCQIKAANVKPTVSISVSGDSSTCSGAYLSGATVTYTCSSDSAITSFSSSGGSGSGTYSRTVTQTLSSTGSKSLSISCTNAAGTSSSSKTVSIKEYSEAKTCGYTDCEDIKNCSHCGSTTSYGSWSSYTCTTTQKKDDSTTDWSCEKDTDASYCNSSKYYKCRSRSITTTCNTCEICYAYKTCCHT